MLQKVKLFKTLWVVSLIIVVLCTISQFTITKEGGFWQNSVGVIGFLAFASFVINLAIYLFLKGKHENTQAREQEEALANEERKEDFALWQRSDSPKFNGALNKRVGSTSLVKLTSDFPAMELAGIGAQKLITALKDYAQSSAIVMWHYSDGSFKFEWHDLSSSQVAELFADTYHNPQNVTAIAVLIPEVNTRNSATNTVVALHGMDVSEATSETDSYTLILPYKSGGNIFRVFDVEVHAKSTRVNAIPGSNEKLKSAYSRGVTTATILY